MQIHLSPRHLRLTAATHTRCAEKIEHLEELAGEIVPAHVVLIYDKGANPEERFSVKVHLAVPGPDIHAEERAAELNAALDLVVDKLARQLRKRKTRLKDKPRSKTQALTRRR